MQAEFRERVAALRAAVEEAHAQVIEGRYDVGIAAFALALPELRALLGADHPEVEELEADLAAARQMREVHDFGAAVGYRGWGRPDDDGERGS